MRIGNEFHKGRKSKQWVHLVVNHSPKDFKIMERVLVKSDPTYIFWVVKLDRDFVQIRRGVYLLSLSPEILVQYEFAGMMISKCGRWVIGLN